MRLGQEGLRIWGGMPCYSWRGAPWGWETNQHREETERPFWAGVAAASPLERSERQEVDEPTSESRVRARGVCFGAHEHLDDIGNGETG